MNAGSNHLCRSEVTGESGTSIFIEFVLVGILTC